MNVFLRSTAIVISLSVFVYSHAGVPAPVAPTVVTTGSGSSKSSTKAYVGLNWTTEGGMTPALLLGVMRAKVKSNGDTTGANLAFHLNLAGGVKPSKVKLSYLNGKEDLQGEFGAGYDLIKAKPVGFLGLNAAHVAVGLDGFWGAGVVPYLTIHTMDAWKKPTGTTTTVTCPAGFGLDGNQCVFGAPPPT